MRTLNGIDLDALEYRKLSGVVKVAPAKDLSGVQYELDQEEERKLIEDSVGELRGKMKAEEELAAAALTA